MCVDYEVKVHKLVLPNLHLKLFLHKDVKHGKSFNLKAVCTVKNQISVFSTGYPRAIQLVFKFTGRFSTST